MPQKKMETASGITIGTCFANMHGMYGAIFGMISIKDKASWFLRCRSEESSWKTWVFFTDCHDRPGDSRFLGGRFGLWVKSLQALQVPTYSKDILEIITGEAPFFVPSPEENSSKLYAAWKTEMI